MSKIYKSTSTDKKILQEALKNTESQEEYRHIQAVLLRAQGDSLEKTGEKRTLPTEETKENRHIARERILIENINAKVKVFKFMSNKYRNRRKRHDLCTNPICGTINFETRF